MSLFDVIKYQIDETFLLPDFEVLPEPALLELAKFVHFYHPGMKMGHTEIWWLNRVITVKSLNKRKEIVQVLKLALEQL